jgi:hypothetical protein
MPADVRIEIEDHKSLLAAMDDEIRFIVLSILRDATKDALVLLGICS